jgi:hypothetical protein
MDDIIYDKIVGENGRIFFMRSIGALMVHYLDGI